MENKKNNLGDIYTSYGPFVGKICENANTQLCQDKIIESLTSSLTEKSTNLNYPEINKINYTNSTTYANLNANTNQKSNSNIKINDNLNLEIKESLFEGGSNKNDENTGFFGYKVSFGNFKISIWILILIIIVILCIGYFIYKYWYSKNTIVSYVKNDSVNLFEKKKNNDIIDDMTSKSSDNSSSNSSSDSSSNSSNKSNSKSSSNSSSKKNNL